MFLILASVLTLAQVELFPFEGKPIVSVDVRGPDGENLDLIRSLLDIQPGYLFATPDVSRGVRRIYALGRFSDVAVSVVPIGAVVSVGVDVKIQQVLGELTFSGDTEEELTREMRGALPPQQALDEALVQQVERKVEKVWESIGYPLAKCQAFRQPAKRQRVDLDVQCSRGPAARVKRVEFAGNMKARDYQLLKELQVVTGTLFAERRVKADDKALRVAYYKRGFLSAQIKLDTTKERDGVVLRYSIDAGPHVALRVAGNQRFSDSELLALVKREAEEPMTASLLDAWRRAAIDKYVQRGFTYASGAVKTYRDPARDVLFHVLTIDEGKRYRVQSMVFPGAQHFSDVRLRDEVLAFVNQRIDPPVATNEVNRSAVRALEDADLGVKAPPRLRPATFDHWLYRYDPEAVYEPEAYKQAEDAIRRLYLEQGYTRVEVGPLTLERDDAEGKLAVKLPVREGPRAIVNTLVFTGSNALEVTEMLDLAKLSGDEPFSELAVEETRAAVQKALAQRGYLYARVEPAVDFDPTLTQASVRFAVSDGPQVFVSRVLIQGNDETREGVIRDRVLLDVDKPYSPDTAQTTKDELQRLQVFDSTNVGLADPDVPAEQKDVLVRLLERKSQSFDVGLGLSTAQGLRGYAEYSDRNLAGTAQQLTLRAQLNRQLFFSPIFYPRYSEAIGNRFQDQFTTSVGSDGVRRFDPRRFFLESIERLLRASWRTPRVLKLPGRPQIYAELTNERLNTLAFSLDSYGLLLGVDLQPITKLRTTLETSVALNGLQCFSFTDDASSDSGSCDIRNLGRPTFVAEGQFINWKTGPSVFVDFRDDSLNPRSGFLFVLKTDLVIGQQLGTRSGAPLPVDPRYAFIKAEGQLSGYVPLSKRNTLALSGRIGNIFRVSGDESLLRTQLNELFFLGGRNTMRGFFEQSVLPQDACVVSPNAPSSSCARPENRFEYDPKSADPPPVSPGAFYYLLKAELRFPLFGDVLGSVFVDAGNLYFQASAFQPLAVLVNVGAGLRYQTPVGALAIDLGFNPIPRADRGEVIVAYPYIYVGLF